jgi:hypothetical protein
MTNRVEKTVAGEQPKQKWEVDGSCIRTESKEEIFSSNRLTAINSLVRDITGDRLRVNAATSNSEENEIVHILKSIRRYKISPKEDLGITDLLRCLVDRIGPNGKPTELHLSKLKELINTYTSGYESESESTTVQAEIGIRMSTHSDNESESTTVQAEVGIQRPTSSDNKTDLTTVQAEVRIRRSTRNKEPSDPDGSAERKSPRKKRRKKRHPDFQY